MKTTALIITLFICVCLFVSSSFLMGQGGDLVQEKQGIFIKQIAPISDATPVTIKTIQYRDINGAITENQTVTKGMSRKYRYDIDYNKNYKKLKLANLFYDEWFVSVNLYDSDPNDQKYGYWISEDDGSMSKDICLYVFGQNEQYLVWKTGGGIFMKNIYEPIDKTVELEKRINSNVRLDYAIDIFGLDMTRILSDEADKDAAKVKIVSFRKEKDNDFCVKVESPKSKSVFTYTVDKERTKAMLELYNRENKTEVKVPLPGTVHWKCVGFKTPGTEKTKKLSRTWFLPTLGGDDWHHEATFVSCDGKNVTLDENGKKLNIELSQLYTYDKEYVRLILEAEKPDSDTPAVKTK
jgi:hypothetical protein